MMRVVVAITGASGALYSQRVLHGLLAAGVETHLVVSPLGRRLLHDELGIARLDDTGLADLTGRTASQLVLHNYNDVGAVIASGSFLHDGMVIVPCSSNTLCEVAHGLGDNLISRAAAVTLKERRRLIIAHREMPMSPMDVTAYGLLTAAGAIVAPTNPGLYLNPTSIAEVVDFVAGKLLDLLGVRHELNTRWDPKSPRPAYRFSPGGEVIAAADRPGDA
jgi:flavin prenyltransferase